MRHNTLQAEPILHDIHVMELSLNYMREAIVGRGSVPELALAKLNAAREALKLMVAELEEND
jgi:hypothetical protein